CCRIRLLRQRLPPPLLKVPLPFAEPLMMTALPTLFQQLVPLVAWAVCPAALEALLSPPTLQSLRLATASGWKLLRPERRHPSAETEMTVALGQNTVASVVGVVAAVHPRDLGIRQPV
ncbi:hypothetical protein Vretifemale_2992, partial [Volvox reticuliferus]